MSRDESDMVMRLIASVSKAEQRASSLQARLDAAQAAGEAALDAARAREARLARENAELSRELRAARTEMGALRASNVALLREAESTGSVGTATGAGSQQELKWLRCRVIELEDALEAERSEKSELEARFAGRAAEDA